jgi:hypothetical protein
MIANITETLRQPAAGFGVLHSLVGHHDQRH